MKKTHKSIMAVSIIAILLAMTGCGKVPVKKFYLINYDPEPVKERKFDGPYPYTVRVKEFEIEQAYARPQIVYRKSPYELEYYYYRVWAVKPVRMITDAVHKHLSTSGLISHVIRRYDEGIKPDYELSGYIEAIEEYDSEDAWFAHIALRIKLTRLSDGRTMYLRSFDKRKRVFQREPEYVIRELSQIMDFIMSQALRDIDVVLAIELGVLPDEPAAGSDTLSAGENRE